MGGDLKEPKPRWELIPTPNPYRFALSVVVPMSTIVNKPGAWPQENSTFAQFPWAADPALKTASRFGDYIYTDNQSSPGFVTFIFGPNLTEAQKMTPFRVQKDTGNHYWPPILQALRFITDPSFPQSVQGPSGETIFAPRYYVREVFIPGVNEGTQFITEEFYSPTPFDIPQYPAPEPTAVSYDFLGVKGSFPECLHPKIVLTDLRTATAVYTAGGTTGQAGGVLPGQIFPATNFEEWSPYFLSGKQSFVSVGYHFIRIQVRPPLIPETIVR